MAKTIILLSDGTGNSRSDQFRTNVWKLYDALDLTDKSRQIAYYDDGVGTSHFAPIRLLGGALGYGLARNVRDLYAFLCANYEPGDRIFLFGFSRGAFTVRVLAGLIGKKGIWRIDDEVARNAQVAKAFREYRAAARYSKWYVTRTVTVAVARGIKAVFRAIGAGAGAALRGLGGARPDPGRREHYPPVEDGHLIRFVGVWDTVAAYGGPIVEMTRGFDKWVRPLSMPDYRLNPQVRRAAHALALDDEREAFLPLLWDESQETDPGRITQVWFSGMHSDVGGGYPDDGLSSVPLRWMIAKAGSHLSFIPEKIGLIDRQANAHGPMHDSRSGAAMFYRYQPRRIEALAMDGKSPIRDPASGDWDLLRKVIVHHSVIDRAAKPIDGYAPIVLPGHFEGETPENGAAVSYATDNDVADRIVRLVIMRRLLHFFGLLTVGLTLATPRFGAFALPMVEKWDALLIPVVRAALSFVPLLPDTAADAYAGYGVPIVGSALIVLILTKASNALRLKIAALALPMWKTQLATSHESAEEKAVLDFPWYLRLYRAGNRIVRWHILPALFGWSFYVVLAIAIVQAAQFWRENILDKRPVCHLVKGAPTNMAFRTDEPCHALGTAIEKDKTYQVDLVIGQPWKDGSIDATPVGFTYADRIGPMLGEGRVAEAAGAVGVHLFGIVMRREVTSRWFVPILAIRPADGGALRKVALRFEKLAPCASATGCYRAQFTAPAEGRAFLYVNDAALPLGDPDGDYFYGAAGPGENRGSATVTIAPKLPDAD